MGIFQAIGFMIFGGIIVEVFELHAWQRYQQGKRENPNSTGSVDIPRHRTGRGV